MNVEYVRRLNASHMVTEQKREMNQWELSMIKYNRIEGVLLAKEVSENEIHKLWYDITGKQALDIILENDKLDYGLLCNLMARLLEVTNRLEGLLLPVDYLWLEPETVFVDCRKGEISFCYYPGNEERIQKAFERFVEYLLTKVNHKDEEAVRLIYDLYEQTRQEGYSLLRLLQDIHISYPGEDDTKEKGETCIQERTVTEKVEQKSEEKSNFENGKKNKSGAVKWQSTQGKGKITLFRQSIKDYLLQYFGWDRTGSVKDKKKVWGKDKKEEVNVFTFSSEEEKEVPNLHPTVLLSEIPKKIEGILRYEGEGEQPDLVLDSFPYVIGSDKSCNGYLPGAAVSRRHARVTKQEDIYFIEDLNSSNGTYVGGELLNYRVRMSLQKNEIVVIADKKFRFI